MRPTRFADNRGKQIWDPALELRIEPDSPVDDAKIFGRPVCFSGAVAAPQRMNWWREGDDAYCKWHRGHAVPGTRRQVLSDPYFAHATEKSRQFSAFSLYIGGDNFCSADGE
jgi:hypothetical protein